MNKTLIAMAVAGVMAAPMAAQADATVYGKVHVSVDMMDYDTSGRDNNNVLASNSSRIGFKGSEDLGGGLKAVWKLESGIAVDGESGGLTARNRYIGLKGGWGEVRGGKHDTPVKGLSRKVELFPEYLGDNRNLTMGWDARVNNVVAYLSPKFGGGMQVFAAYTLDTGTDSSTDDNDNTAISATFTWTAGDIFLGAGYETRERDAALTPNDTSVTRLSGSWSPGAWKLVAMWQASDNQGYADGVDGSMMGLGAAYKMGKNVLKAQYYLAEIEDGSGTNEATTLAVGWDYKFSKRSTAYLAYAVTDNDDTGTFRVNSGGHGDSGAQAAGSDPSGLTIGMIHNF
ncbi:MAG: porin [Gammaproteobacteria bacterium]|nr:porin [Gammaproteobacteria bacterium]